MLVVLKVIVKRLKKHVLLLTYLTSCLEFVLFTEAVTAFSWEPGGSKFAIIHGESPRISASFYNMEKQGSVSLLSKYTLGISL